MAIQKSLPFKEGQLAEAKSFMHGYRGAWFRCKIKRICTRKNEVHHAMEYYDYPEEGIKVIKLYQISQRSSKQKAAQKELMVRPVYPRICREDELPNINSIGEVILVVDGVWRVGDLVDWWTDDCFWSGAVTEIEGDDMVKIKLPDPPQGEGFSYSVSCKELRPSLDWSPEYGWVVPTSPEIHNGRTCPRLIQPVKQDSGKHKIENESMSSHTSTISLPYSKGSLQSKVLVEQSKDTSKETKQTHETDVDMSVGGSAVEKSSCSDNVSGTYVREIKVEVPESGSAEEQYFDSGSLKKMRVDETISLNPIARGSLESTIVDLEELANKVKWLRRILKSGSSSNSQQPTWKFVESTPK